jgi:hypothetical protein
MMGEILKAEHEDQPGDGGKDPWETTVLPYLRG